MFNYEVEYCVLFLVLKYCIEYNYSIVFFCIDLQFVEWVVEKEYVKNKIFVFFLDEVLQYIKNFDFFFIKWILSS